MCMCVCIYMCNVVYICVYVCMHPSSMCKYIYICMYCIFICVVYLFGRREEIGTCFHPPAYLIDWFLIYEWLNFSKISTYNFLVLKFTP